MFVLVVLATVFSFSSSFAMGSVNTKNSSLSRKEKQNLNLMKKYLLALSLLKEYRKELTRRPSTSEETLASLPSTNLSELYLQKFMQDHEKIAEIAVDAVDSDVTDYSGILGEHTEFLLTSEMKKIAGSLKKVLVRGNPISPPYLPNYDRTRNERQ